MVSLKYDVHCKCGDMRTTRSFIAAWSTGWAKKPSHAEAILLTSVEKVIWSFFSEDTQTVVPSTNHHVFWSFYHHSNLCEEPQLKLGSPCWTILHEETFNTTPQKIREAFCVFFHNADLVVTVYLKYTLVCLAKPDIRGVTIPSLFILSDDWGYSCKFPATLSQTSHFSPK